MNTLDCKVRRSGTERVFGFAVCRWPWRGVSRPPFARLDPRDRGEILPLADPTVRISTHTRAIRGRFRGRVAENARYALCSVGRRPRLGEGAGSHVERSTDRETNNERKAAVVRRAGPGWLDAPRTHGGLLPVLDLRCDRRAPVRGDGHADAHHHRLDAAPRRPGLGARDGDAHRRVPLHRRRQLALRRELPGPARREPRGDDSSDQRRSRCVHAHGAVQPSVRINSSTSLRRIRTSL